MKQLKVNGTQQFMGKDIPVVLGGFGEGQKCICDKTIAEIHGMETKHVRERINQNIQRFKENVDFIDLKQRVGESHTLEEDGLKQGIVLNDTSDNKRVGQADTLELLQELGYAKQSITQAEHIYLLSERGYAKLVKIMDTDLAWEIHDKLMDEYFTMREILNSAEQEKARLLLMIYNGGQQGLIASKELNELEIREATAPLKKEIEHKEDVIIGLVDDISLAEKRQILNRVVRYNHANYRERWSILYREFEQKYHIDLHKRLESHNEDGKPKCKKQIGLYRQNNAQDTRTIRNCSQTV